MRNILDRYPPDVVDRYKITRNIEPYNNYTEMMPRERQWGTNSNQGMANYPPSSSYLYAYPVSSDSRGRYITFS